MADQQMPATVVDTWPAPLRVVIDGATVDCPANYLDATTFTANQRVTVTVRNPLPPLVMGAET